MQLHQTYHDQGLEVVTLNMEGAEKFEDAQAILSRIGVTITNLCLKEGMSEEALAAVQMDDGILPAIHLYDRTGGLRHHYNMIGESELEALIVELLKEE